MQSCLLFQHKKFASETAKELNTNLEKLTSEEKINALTKSAMEGAMRGSSSPESEEALNELTRILSENIGIELNKVFAKLDTRTPGEKFSKGVVESLINKEVEKSLEEFISATAQNTENNFSDAINNLEKSISASLSRISNTIDKELDGMDESLAQVMSTQLQDSLSNFLNSAIANIELKPLSHKISTDLLSTELRDSIISLASEVQKNIDITEPLPGIVTLVRQNAILLALLGFFLIASLIYWSYYLRKKSILGDDLTEILHKLNESDDSALTNKLESFLKEKGHYEFYVDQVKRLKKKKK